MIDPTSVQKFWSCMAQDVAPRLASGGGPAVIADISEESREQLRKMAPDLTVEVAQGPGGVPDITISASGVLRHFAMVRAIVAHAPVTSNFRALDLRRPCLAPDMVRLADEAVPAARLRVHAIHVLSRYGVLLLTSGVKISDYVQFRNQGRRLVMDIVGEERFGHFVTDVQVMDHADWQAGAQDDESRPLADIAEIIPAAPALSRPFEPQLQDAIQDNRRVA